VFGRGTHSGAGTQGAGGGAAEADVGPGTEDQVRRRLRRHGARLRKHGDRLLQLETQIESLREVVEQAVAHEHHARPRLDRLDLLFDHVETVPASDRGELRLSDPEGRAVMGYADSRPLDPEEAYVAFEALFRGSRAEIQDKQRPYLPLLADAAPVLDLGCGRGEFLELLREAGIEGHGVDLDAEMVKLATAQGLDARVGDLFDELARTPDGSLGAVVCFQVVEHLEPHDVQRLLTETHRVLADAGVAVFETVNPHSVRAFRFFWLDVTHRIPLFPESLLSLARGSGFSAGVAWFPESSGELVEDLRECGDYALVCARGPGPLVARGLLGD